MTQAELRAWLALARTPGLGGARGKRLLQHYGGPAALLEAGSAAWRAAGLSEGACQALAQPDWTGVERDLEWLAQSAAPAVRSFITCQDSRYPPLLTEIAQAPLALFTVGDADLLRLPQLAIVGARSASAQGVENAQAFAAELARRGLTIQRSGARDRCRGSPRRPWRRRTHRRRLRQRPRPGYPARNRELAHAIAARSLLVSEFPTGVPPLPENFPRRNRIISGLALGVLVVEAAQESGSLITARLAAEQGREVFAIPGSIHNPLSRGSHALIREGAKLVETVDDILAELAPQLPAMREKLAPAAPGAAPAGDPDQQQVLQALGFETVALDHLVARLGLPVERIAAALSTLELLGVVTAGPGDTFTRLQSF
jgi:DNA processing protein